MRDTQPADCLILLDDVPLHNTIADRMLLHFDLQMPRLLYNSAQAVLDFLVNHEGDLPPRILLLVDLLMPEMSGLEFVDRMQEMLPASTLDRCRVVMVSSTIDDRDLNAIYAHPLIELFLPKPLSGESLSEFLATPAANGKWGSDMATKI